MAEVMTAVQCRPLLPPALFCVIRSNGRCVALFPARMLMALATYNAASNMSARKRPPAILAAIYWPHGNDDEPSDLTCYAQYIKG